MDWSGVDYCDVFISCLDSHSDGTHSLQSIHCWVSDGMLHFSKSLPMRSQPKHFCATICYRHKFLFCVYSSLFSDCWVHLPKIVSSECQMSQLSFTIALFVLLTSMLLGLLRLSVKVSVLQHTKAVPSFVPTPSGL